jgi:hypothetical protein
MIEARNDEATAKKEALTPRACMIVGVGGRQLCPDHFPKTRKKATRKVWCFRVAQVALEAMRCLLGGRRQHGPQTLTEP